MGIHKTDILVKAKSQKEEVKHSSSLLSSSITCFITCFIVLGSCLYSPTTAVAVEVRAPATISAEAAITSNVVMLSGKGKDSESLIKSRSASNVEAPSIGSGGTGENALKWDHDVDLNENFRILWTIINQDITFEIQARTLGYVGFGFSSNGKLAGADIAIGWVDKGQTYFQDRHIESNENPEPIVDPSQDYILMLGYENATHTVLRFRRKLDTCDTMDDIVIANNTMRLIFMYHNRDPLHGSSEPGTLFDLKSAFHIYYPMVLTQKPQSKFRLDDQIRAVELRNEDVELPSGDNTLYWCKMFKLEDINQKHHLIRIQGQIYYRIGSLLPLPNINQMQMQLQLQIFFTENLNVELDRRCEIQANVRRAVVEQVQILLHQENGIAYEPIFDTPASVHYLQQITLHECQGSEAELEKMGREQGRQCMENRDIPLACNAIVASWSRGSEGFTYPDEAGYPIESQVAKYYLMESHYNNLQSDYTQLHIPQMADNSGLRIYFTHLLRPNDAGILSIGLDGNWRHIIPPGQKEVISEGQCIEDCTAYAFPSQGIHIFAVMMRTHQIGKQVKLRQIRLTEELPPIAMDTNIDSAYQDFRHLPTPVRTMPGDRLIAECIYDSSSRKAITLGGLTMKEESCTVLTIYYPRQKDLTTCHSLPSLPTVLHSLGIAELATDSNPVLISSPPELAGMTLEDRLISYDWENQFNKFQDATRSGSFKPLCWGANNHIIPGSEYLEGYSINITKTYKKYLQCKPKQRIFEAEGMRQADMELPVLHEVDNNNIIEGAARSSRSSAATETLGLNKAHSNRDDGH